MCTFDSINIGAVIARERKRRGMTQGEVADFVGVSKAAVSKWELGISLPDITLLPKLSGLFSISLEELLDYEATLPEEAVREVRDRLFEEFQSDAASAFDHLDVIVRLHYSSWLLLLTAAALLLTVSNGGVESVEAADSERFIHRAVEYCERVERECPNEALAYRARKLHAILLLLTLNKTSEGLDDIIALLGPNAETDTSYAPLLAEAYFISGDMQAANRLFQRMLTNGVDLILASLPFVIQLAPDGNETVVAGCGSLAASLYSHFGSEVVDPLVVLGILFSVASISLSRGNEGDAQSALSSYAATVLDLDATDHAHGRDAPLNVIAKTVDSESLGELIGGGNTLRYVEGALRILRLHLVALSSSSWLRIAETGSYRAAIDGAQRAVARLEKHRDGLSACIEIMENPDALIRDLAK